MLIKMLATLKFVTLVTIFLVMINLSLHFLQSFPPAEANRLSYFSVIAQRNQLQNERFRYRKSLQFKNVGENNACSSSPLVRIKHPTEVVCDLSLVHIAMTLDIPYIRGTLAAVHSILHNSLCPENIFFHFIYSDANPILQSLVKDVFPSLKFKAYYFHPDMVKNKISSSVRQTLEQPLNYARIYFVHLLEACIERVIYLDSDVILVDDISKLWRTSLGSATVGSPEYCQVNFTQFFTPKFWSQKRFSRVFAGRNPCYFNTGEE